MMATALIELVTVRPAFHVPVFAAGVICAVGSFWIRRQAIRTLGQFWSLHVEIREQQPLIRSGPFRWVRHPAYTSMLLELVSVGLILHAFFSLLISLLLFIPTLIWRLRLEEHALIEKFGDAYREYRKTTPALFPLRIPRR